MMSAEGYPRMLMCQSDFADNDVDGTQGIDPNQLIGTYVAPAKTEPQYIVGTKPGPYVAEHSFNIYTRLGARIALLGIDARTEVSFAGCCVFCMRQMANELIAYSPPSQLPRNLRPHFPKIAERAKRGCQIRPAHQTLDPAARHSHCLPRTLAPVASLIKWKTANKT